MAENDSATATEQTPEPQQDEKPFDYPVKIEDAGPATKKVTVEIPGERITEKLAQQFKDLRKEAAIPGFRVGHAPQKLIEKRFNADVREEVRRSLLKESYEQAVEKNSLQVLGDPEFDNAEEIKLPDNGALTYSFQVEVQPDIKLPDLTDLKIKKPKLDITDDNVDQAMNNLREQQGTLVPVEDRGVQAKDYITADVHVKVGGEVVGHQHDAQIVARPGRLSGIQIDDLDDQLKGMKSGDKRDIKAKASDAHPDEKVKGKDVEIEVAVKDIKQLELAEVDETFLQGLGFKDEKELREALRAQLVERIGYDVQQSMREQVNNYLLENVKIDLPTKLSDRQADRVVSRRAVDLMMRGMPRDQVEANLEKLQTGAKDEAIRELKLFFILQQVATESQVDVDEAELNGKIAMLAAQRGQRPEKMKQAMAKDGTLANLFIQMREQKAVDKVLEKAKIEEVEIKEEKK